MRDIYRLTLVHIAPASENAHALCALLSVDPQVIPGDLKGRKNQDGITRGIGVLDAFDERAYGDIGRCVEGLFGIR